MKRLLKNKKGMSFLEVLIALGILGLLSVPIMMMFMNAQIYAKKVDKQTEINAVTRTVTQIVSDGFKTPGEGALLFAPDSTEDIDIDGDGSAPDGFRKIIKYARDVLRDKYTTPVLKIEGSGINEKYVYKITYDPANYHDANYEGVYSLLVTIIEKESGKVVNELKMSVNVNENIN
ncbi:MAG: prepilin-type N-terminal cleavage/methylation domain-containing protein [Clostridiaceae bacterium]|jgi:prepilin-type N-terminal cleavage/methylation domain-containing protein|nr:prepilin-type N-terminal cleavage/methylation domain-containing protein [Clostridiaceae bacterium]